MIHQFLILRLLGMFSDNQKATPVRIILMLIGYELPNQHFIKIKQGYAADQ
jgi:hypothetical protein